MRALAHMRWAATWALSSYQTRQAKAMKIATGTKTATTRPGVMCASQWIRRNEIKPPCITFRARNHDQGLIAPPAGNLGTGRRLR